MKLKVIFSIFAFLAIFGLIKPVNIQASFSSSFSDVFRFSDGSVVEGAESNLSRFKNGAFAKLTTYTLTSQDVYTMWWVIFNNPENCSHGVGGFRCGEGDIAEASVNASLVHAAGRIATKNGKAIFSDYLSKNNAHGVLIGPGLTNPEGADIHFVVRSHGPKLPGLLREQLSTFGGGCNNADIFPVDEGTPGPNTCEDQQFAVHESL